MSCASAVWGVASIVGLLLFLLPRISAICGEFCSAADGSGSEAEAPDGTVIEALSSVLPRPSETGADNPPFRSLQGFPRPGGPASDLERRPRVGSSHASSRRPRQPALPRRRERVRRRQRQLRRAQGGAELCV